MDSGPFLPARTILTRGARISWWKRKIHFHPEKNSSQVRNNPLGLAEPSVKRDGYAVGSREGSMYRRFLKGKKKSCQNWFFCSARAIWMWAAVWPGAGLDLRAKTFRKATGRKGGRRPQIWRWCLRFCISCDRADDLVFRDPGSEWVATWSSRRPSRACPLEAGEGAWWGGGRWARSSNFQLWFVFKGEQKLATTEDDSILLNFANINNFHDAASFNGTRADSSESRCFIW